MSESMMVRGFVATEPEQRTTEQGLHVTKFRLAQTPRRFDRQANAWVDGETNWFSVSCFRELALNVSTSVKKGHPVMVTGKLRIKNFTRNDGTPGTSVEIDADTVGHDLRFGTGTFGRSHREQQAPAPADPQDESQDASQDETGAADDAARDADTQESGAVDGANDGAAEGAASAASIQREAAPGFVLGKNVDPLTGEVKDAA